MHRTRLSMWQFTRVLAGTTRAPSHFRHLLTGFAFRGEAAATLAAASAQHAFRSPYFLYEEDFGDHEGGFRLRDASRPVTVPNTAHGTVAALLTALGGAFHASEVDPHALRALLQTHPLPATATAAAPAHSAGPGVAPVQFVFNGVCWLQVTSPALATLLDRHRGRHSAAGENATTPSAPDGPVAALQKLWIARGVVDGHPAFVARSQFAPQEAAPLELPPWFRPLRRAHNLDDADVHPAVLSAALAAAAAAIEAERNDADHALFTYACDFDSDAAYEAAKSVGGASFAAPFRGGQRKVPTSDAGGPRATMTKKKTAVVLEAPPSDAPMEWGDAILEEMAAAAGLGSP